MARLVRKQFKLVSVLVLSGLVLAVWVTALLADEPPEGLWLTEDGQATIATGPCDKNSPTLCGVIVGLPGARKNPALARYRKELCGLPVIWDLKWLEQKKRWQEGKILDPETGKVHNLFLRAKTGKLLLRAYERVETLGAALTWIRTDVVDGICSER